MFVYKRMTPNPVTVSKDVSILDAMEVMRVSKVRRLPVIDGEKLVGIVTSRDLHMASPSYATTLSKYEANYLLQKMRISDIMSKDLFTTTPKATIEEVALLMYKNKISGVPVVDEKQPEKIVGIITETDIFKLLVGLMGLPEGKKVRITATFQDKVGMLAEIGEIFRDLQQNISSVVLLNGEVEGREIVIRGDFDKVEDLQEAMQKRGFAVTDITRIV